MANQLGDTTYTKVFVGGLAWETQKETLKKYFEQFGDILEGVVISDKNTGRSKGYGFVTFREPEAAMRACVDPSPVIDGRRANCNLASLGVQRTRPPTPQHGGNRSYRIMKSYQGGLQSGIAAAFPSPMTFPHYAIHQGIPYSVYGYSPYSPDYPCPTTFYNVYGGAGGQQHPLYGGAGAGNGMVAGTNAAFYPYFQLGHGQTGYGLQQYPQLFQYSEMSSAAGLAGFTAHQYGVSPAPLAPSTPAQLAGMPMTIPAPSPAANHHFRLIPSPFPAATVREQPLV